MSLSQFPWLRLDRITQRVGQAPDEGGIDIGLPNHTAITSLCNGVIVGAGNFWHSNGDPGFGVVTIQCDVPGLGKSDIYYQHIDIEKSIKFCQLNGCKGQTVSRGQLIGWSKTPPGDLEIGINAPWTGVWGPTKKPGTWVHNPELYLKNLANATNVFIKETLPGLSGQDTGSSSVPAPPVPGAQFFNDILNKILLFLVALTLIGAGFYLMFDKQINHALKTGASIAVKAALV